MDNPLTDPGGPAFEFADAVVEHSHAGRYVVDLLAEGSVETANRLIDSIEPQIDTREALVYRVGAIFEFAEAAIDPVVTLFEGTNALVEGIEALA